MPCPEPNPARKPGQDFANYSGIALADQERRIADTEIEPITVAQFRIAEAGSSRVAIEHGQEKGLSLVGSILRRTPGVDSG
jgi:hypothetical protein